MKRSLIMIISAMTISLYIFFNAVIIEAGEPEEEVIIIKPPQANVGLPVLLNATKKENGQITTQEQAAELASILANEKFQASFGVSPFKPESYQATLVGSRWCWGKINAASSVNGCSAKVEFNKDGSEPDVKVAFHTDAVTSHPIKVPQGIQEIVPKMPEIDLDPVQ